MVRLNASPFNGLSEDHVIIYHIVSKIYDFVSMYWFKRFNNFFNNLW